MLHVRRAARRWAASGPPAATVTPPPGTPPTWPQVFEVLKTQRSAGGRKRLKLEKLLHLRQFPGYRRVLSELAEAGVALTDDDALFIVQDLYKHVSETNRSVGRSGPLAGHDRLEEVLQCLRSMDKQGLLGEKGMNNNYQLQGYVFLMAAMTNHRVYKQLRAVHVRNVREKKPTFATVVYQEGLLAHLFTIGDWARAQALANKWNFQNRPEMCLLVQRMPSNFGVAQAWFQTYVEHFQTGRDAWTDTAHKSPEIVAAYCQNILDYGSLVVLDFAKELWDDIRKSWQAPEHKHAFLRAVGMHAQVKEAIRDHPDDSRMRVIAQLALARSIPTEGRKTARWLDEGGGAEGAAASPSTDGLQHEITRAVFPFPDRPVCRDVREMMLLLRGEAMEGFGSGEEREQEQEPRAGTSDAAENKDAGEAPPTETPGKVPRIRKVVLPDRQALFDIIDHPPPQDTLVLLTATLLAHFYVELHHLWQVLMELMDAGGLNAQVIHLREEILCHHECGEIGVPFPVNIPLWLKWPSIKQSLDPEQMKDVKKMMVRRAARRVRVATAEGIAIQRGLFSVGFVVHEIMRPIGVAVEVHSSSARFKDSECMEAVETISQYTKDSKELVELPKMERGYARWRYADIDDNDWVPMTEAMEKRALETEMKKAMRVWKDGKRRGDTADHEQQDAWNAQHGQYTGGEGGHGYGDAGGMGDWGGGGDSGHAEGWGGSGSGSDLGLHDGDWDDADDDGEDFYEKIVN